MYSDCLVNANLLKNYRINGKIEVFETTEKGKDFISHYKKIKNLLEHMTL